MIEYVRKRDIIHSIKMKNVAHRRKRLEADIYEMD